MRKQTRKIANLGTINLSKMELLDSLEIYIDIADLSADLKETVEKAVEDGKCLHEVEDKAYMERFSQKWCDAGVTTTPQLHITLPENGKIQYELYVFIQDLEDEDLCTSVALELDLSEHIAELKRIIFHVLVDKFI